MFVFLAACAPKTADVQRIALLAPFEGRYREVGYNALYAARLALNDIGSRQLELFPVDSGGSSGSARARAEALALDPLVKAAIVLGYDEAAPETQSAFGDLPVLVVGNWDTLPARPQTFILASPALRDTFTTPERVSVIDAAILNAPMTGGEVFALEQFPRLRESLDEVFFASSGQMPGDDFTARYQAGDPFAPEPGLLAMLAYDATHFAADAILTDPSRAAVTTYLDAQTYQGASGSIRFDNGFWTGAPLNYFRFDEAGNIIGVVAPS